MLGSSLSALGVVRSLGRNGIPLHVLTPDPGPCAESRWYRPPPHGRFLEPADSLADYLRELPLDQAVLIPASDEDAEAVASLPSDLKEEFPTSQAPPDVIADMVDKNRFADLLERHGIPHPRTISAERPDIVHCLSDDQVERFFIKPTDSQAFFRRFGVKALRPTGREELTSQLEMLKREGFSVVLQEEVPGPSHNHWFLDGFVDRSGSFRALLARRRLRAYPPEFGNSCATVSVPLGDVAPAVADIERLFGSVGYRGMFDAEFKEDARTGVFQLIEINVRAWWQLEFSEMCGLDVVEMAYRDALRLKMPEAGGYRIGVKWIIPYRDFFASRLLLDSGDLTLVQWVRNWLTSRWAGCAFDDPMPALTTLWSRALGFMQRRLPGGRRAVREAT